MCVVALVFFKFFAERYSDIFMFLIGDWYVFSLF